MRPLPDPYFDKPPVYILTKDGLKSQEDLQKPPVKNSKHTLGSPWLSFSLLCALLAYFFNGNRWTQAAENFMTRKQAVLAAEPYRLWAKKNPLSYSEVASSPTSFAGKAVIWEIMVEADGSSYCELDPLKKFLWTADSVNLRIPHKTGQPFKILARIDGTQNDLPLLMLLQIL